MGGGKKGEELGRPGWEESGPRRKRWGPEQLSLLKCVSVPEAARLAQIEQFGRIEGIRHPQLGAVGGGGGAGRAPGPGPLVLWEGSIQREGFGKASGERSWLEPKGSPVRYQGQG